MRAQYGFYALPGCRVLYSLPKEAAIRPCQFEVCQRAMRRSVAARP